MDALKPELRTKLQATADGNNVAVISFVAPQEAVRISPVSFVSAAIEEHDMYRLEEFVTEIKSIKTLQMWYT
jgi:hypothetical protein